jgi:hypothetical protein
MLKARQAKTPEQVAAVLKEFDGHHIARLVECDGVYARVVLIDRAVICEIGPNLVTI